MPCGVQVMFVISLPIVVANRALRYARNWPRSRMRRDVIALAVATKRRWFEAIFKSLEVAK